MNLATSEFDDDAIVLRDQAAVAIYLNSHGEIVIRQINWPDDDSCIVIASVNARAVADKIISVLADKV